VGCGAYMVNSMVDNEEGEMNEKIFWTDDYGVYVNGKIVYVITVLIVILMWMWTSFTGLKKLEVDNMKLDIIRIETNLTKTEYNLTQIESNFNHHKHKKGKVYY
jgi:hypothetical protein